MGCNWKLECYVAECSEEDNKKIRELLTKNQIDFEEYDDDVDYIIIYLYASYGFSVKGWVKEYYPDFLKMKNLTIHQYCLEQEPDEVFEGDEDYKEKPKPNVSLWKNKIKPICKVCKRELIDGKCSKC